MVDELGFDNQAEIEKIQPLWLLDMSCGQIQGHCALRVHQAVPSSCFG